MHSLLDILIPHLLLVQVPKEEHIHQKAPEEEQVEVEHNLRKRILINLAHIRGIPLEQALEGLRGKQGIKPF